MNDGRFSPKKFGVDLNVKMQIRKNPGPTTPGVAHEDQHDFVRPTDGFFALDDLNPTCRSTWWWPLCQIVCLHRAVPGNGLCKTDLPREFARYRSLLVGTDCQALPHGFPARDQALDTGRCQQDARLAHSCRIFSVSDCSGAQTLHRRHLRYRVGEHGIRTGFDDTSICACRSFHGRCFASPSRR